MGISKQLIDYLSEHFFVRNGQLYQKIIKMVFLVVVHCLFSEKYDVNDVLCVGHWETT